MPTAKVIYTDFEDEIGVGRTIDLAGFDGGPDDERFLVIDHLAANGVVPAARFARCPFLRSAPPVPTACLPPTRSTR